MSYGVGSWYRSAMLTAVARALRSATRKKPCAATIKVIRRIASSKMFLNVQPLPHISCSLLRGMSRGDYGAAEHGD
jgi:hypothetical protein